MIELESKSTVEQALRARLDVGEKALVPFLVAGFPNPVRFVAALRRVEDSGCDVVEVGVPFSDPIADGPVIQNASRHSLQKGMTLRATLDLIDRAGIEIPVVLMSYINPLISYGCHRLARDARAVGVRGFVIPDLPLVESRRYGGEPVNPGTIGPMDAIQQLERDGFELIRLAAPTTRTDRLRRIGSQTRGFLYAVTITGVTGVRNRIPGEAVAFIRRARAATHRPVLAGFGIANVTSAALVASHCDGVIIGSALVEILEKGSDRTSVAQLGRFLNRMRRMLSSVSEPPLPGRERVGVRVGRSRSTPHLTSPLKGRGVSSRIPNSEGED